MINIMSMSCSLCKTLNQLWRVELRSGSDVHPFRALQMRGKRFNNVKVWTYGNGLGDLRGATCCGRSLRSLCSVAHDRASAMVAPLWFSLAQSRI